MSFSNYVETTEDYSNLTLIELKFQEMRREVIRIGEIATDVKSSISSLISAINTLASLVGASSISSSASIGKIEETEKSISKFVTSQIERYASLNEITYERVRILDNLIMQLFDKDGQLVTYTIDGKEVTETFTNLLNKKEIETALTNSTKDGYRDFENDKLNEIINSAPDGWDTLETMYAFFADKGLTDEQIAGVLGNAALESGFELTVLNREGSGAKGLFQWTSERYPSDWSLETQLEHAWNEMETRRDMSGYSVNQHLQNCSTADGAASSFAIFFEGCTEGFGGRLGYANTIYNYIKKMKNDDTPKLV